MLAHTTDKKSHQFGTFPHPQQVCTREKSLSPKTEQRLHAHSIIILLANFNPGLF